MEQEYPWWQCSLVAVLLAERHYSQTESAARLRRTEREHCNDRQNPISLLQPRDLSRRRHDTAAVAAGYRATAWHRDGSRMGNRVRRVARPCDLVPTAARSYPA